MYHQLIKLILLITFVYRVSTNVCILRYVANYYYSTINYNIIIVHVIYISQICRLQGSCSTAVAPPPPLQGDKSNTVYCLVLPYVILWNPVFRNRFPLCSETLKVCSKYAQYDGKQVLHDINNIVLLVSAIYQCNKNSQHILYSTDPRILKHINPIWIPFHLLHCTDTYLLDQLLA